MYDFYNTTMYYLLTFLHFPKEAEYYSNECGICWWSQ